MNDRMSCIWDRNQRLERAGLRNPVSLNGAMETSVDWPPDKRVGGGGGGDGRRPLDAVPSNRNARNGADQQRRRPWTMDRCRTFDASTTAKVSIVEAPNICPAPPPPPYVREVSVGNAQIKKKIPNQ